jgi:broad specificity polyphosphatase/5'/3'-nucleotidase SurE
MVDMSAENNPIYRLSQDFDFSDPHHESDIGRLRDGYITITPLKVDLTDHDRLKDFEKFLGQ